MKEEYINKEYNHSEIEDTVSYLNLFDNEEDTVLILINVEHNDDYICKWNKCY